MPDTPDAPPDRVSDGGSSSSTCSALDEQRNALAEARFRVIARMEEVRGWLGAENSERYYENWGGMVEGLRQARMIIGSMWDELPVPKPQAVIDHEESTHTDHE